MLLGWVKQHYLWISDKERQEIFTPTKNSYFIGARWKCSPEDNNTDLERTTHYFTFSSLWSYAATSVFIGMFCFAHWTGRQRFNSKAENVGKSPHCDCLRGVISQFLSSSTLVHCPVLYPTMYIHWAQQIVGNSCLLGIQQVSASAVCLLLQSYVFLTLNEQVMLLCVVKLCVEKVGCEQDWLWAGFLIWH